MRTSVGTTSFRRRTTAVALTAVVALVGAILGTPAAARSRAEGAMRYHRATAAAPALFDARPGRAVAAPSARAVRAQRALVAELGPQGVVDVDEATGRPRVVARLDGFLTEPSEAPPEEVALDFVRTHLPVFGLRAADLDRLRLVREYVDILGTHHLVWQQVVAGIPTWDNDLRAHVTADGKLVAVTGSPLPALRGTDVRPESEPAIAVAAAYRAVGARARALGAPTRAKVGPQLRTTFRSGDDARLVLFGTGRSARLAWRTTTHVAEDQIDVSIVDDSTGQVLWRANLVKSDQTGHGLAWEYYPSTTVPNDGGVQHEVAFPVEDATALAGNNAWTFPDTDDDDRPDRQIPATSGLRWDYPATLDTTTDSNACSVAFPCSWIRGEPFSWRPNVEQNATQVYHFLNTFHDHLLDQPIGFTEAAGNFELVNGSGQGEGGDPVIANVLDGANTSSTRGLPDAAHRLNANMFTPPDGSPPWMQMYLFPSIPQLGTPSANGGDDASVVYHEYAHGLSNRLITFADGTGAVNSAHAAAMGEAWSDFYAMDFLVKQGFEVDGPNADVIVGKYVGGGRPSFIRFEAIDCRVGEQSPNCPGGVDTGPGGFTFGDFGHVFIEPEVHSDGEIWVQTLWDIRSAIGSNKALMLVTRAMELSPPEPSFLDMRNAILAADHVAFGGANASELWDVFAERGMGFFAVVIDGTDTTPVESFEVPPDCPAECGSLSGTVTDSTGRPVEGVRVGFAGHDTGLVNDLVATTDARGTFTIQDVPLHRYVLTVRSNAHEPFRRPIRVAGDEDVRVGLIRDWAAIGGGARLMRSTGPDYSEFHCGADRAFDTSIDTGWASTTVDNPADRGGRGPRVAVVRLPETVDVTTFGFATGGICGDGPQAGVRVFEIQTKTRSGRWVTAYERSRRLREDRLHTLRPVAGTRNVRFVKMIMLDNYGDPKFMDMLELTVRGR